MNHFAVVATHHKTGTVWMRTVFRRIADTVGVPFVNIKEEDPSELRAMPAPVIFFNHHSNFKTTRWMLRDDGFRIMHLIRDPRDVIVSAMHYHRKATEKWLHVPHESFSGKTYQETLNALGDDYSRYRFEMENSAGRVIRDMSGWNYGLPNSFECRYETLMTDSDMNVFRQILGHLGVDAGEIDACLRQFWKHSLFGKLGNSARVAKSNHIRSGEVTQWRNVFDRNLARIFLDKFGDALINLGYEPNHSWADELPSEAMKD